MTTTAAHMRLDEVETYLAPKQWAIRLADERRKYPTPLAYNKALVKLPFDQLTVRRAFFALEEQASEQHPGQTPEEIHARHRRTQALWNEFHTLKLLILQVNRVMQQKVERIGLETALRLSALQALILEDVFAHTSAQAAALITTQKQRGAKSERQTVLKLLGAFKELGISEMPLEEWSAELTAPLKDFFAHRAAVELIQGQHFDGHPILFPELEAELTEAMRTIESAVVTANEYLKRRAGRDGADTDGGACESDLIIALESIKASANGQRAAVIAAKWLNDIRKEAVETDAEQWEQLREEFGERARLRASCMPRC